jgi:hypothetical protein
MVRKHSGMSLLQSDFSRHSLANPLGPAELRVFIKYHALIFLCYTYHRPMYSIVLTQSSGPTPSGSLEIGSGRLNLPMSLHPSLNTFLSYLIYVLPTQNGRE